MNSSVFANPSEISRQKRRKLHQAAGQRLAATGIAAAFAASLAILVYPVGGAIAAQATQIREVDDPGRIAYESEQIIGQGQDRFIFPVVPAGHRLVIQHASAIVIFNSAVSEVTAAVSSPEGFSTFLPPILSNSTRFDQLVQLYVDAGNHPIVVVGANSTVSAGNMTLTGYLLDCTIAPCAQIAH
jgi:hypothetical protein